MDQRENRFYRVKPEVVKGADILDELHALVRTGGDTYSSMEVLGIVSRAEVEIGRLRSMLHWIDTYTDIVATAEERFGPVDGSE